MQSTSLPVRADLWSCKCEKTGLFRHKAKQPCLHFLHQAVIMEQGDIMDYSICPESRDVLLFNHVSTEREHHATTGSHAHNTYELLYFNSIDATYIVEDKKYKLKKDDLIIVRPHDYHIIEFTSTGRYDRYNVLFDPAALDIDISLLPPDMDVINCRHMPLITDLFKKVDYYYKCFPAETLGKILPLLLKELVFNLSIAVAPSGQEDMLHIHPLICQALERINADIFELDGIGQIARELYVSESYLHRMFKQEMKITPGNYITQKRLLAAKSMLLQGKSPSAVYSECGFFDYSAFYRSYKKFFGYPPSREGHQSNDT